MVVIVHFTEGAGYQVAQSIVYPDDDGFRDFCRTGQRGQLGGPPEVFGARGVAARCQCQRYKLRPKESFASFPRKALDHGYAGSALAIFLRDVVQVRASVATLSRAMALSPRYRRQLIPGQIADYEALQRLGPRLREYAAITQHVLLLTGGKSPEHLRRRSRLLQQALPWSESIEMRDTGHGAPASKPGELADLLMADIGARIEA